MTDKPKGEQKKLSQLDIESLEMHRTGKPGKIEIIATKPLTTQHDLSLAYSPGVAAPCMEATCTSRYATLAVLASAPPL